jgi:hypothetical protein
MLSLALDVDTVGWQAHLEAVAKAVPGLVPVAKGNGYGLGNARLAGRAARLRTPTLAVGTPGEVADVAGPFPGHVLVLHPWDGEPDDADDFAPGRVVRTVSHADVLREVMARPATGRPPVVVEVATSMRRHGLEPDDVGMLADAGVRDVALHLPLARPGDVDPLGEVLDWVRRLDQAGVPLERLWVSHLRDDELDRLSAARAGLQVRARIGTRLWLGAPGVLQVRSSVLDVHRIRRGERYGYRQQRAPADGQLVVAAGGTAHGLGLDVPGSAQGLGGRARSLGRGVLASAGLARSPFEWAGHPLWFAEPPHMQVSLLWLPERVPAPRRGDELRVRARHTILHPDVVRER